MIKHFWTCLRFYTRLPTPADAERIGRAARDIAHADYGWDQLVAQLRPVVEKI